ncbi:helix-turn-helix domain-containing protein [Herbiconiux sp. YIM B11900]|uniref:helix-turn-helix domain-containing protein n=1 Tax=Herbiconiux sp. YIM B11900 TaxID=3404131 RepID=UPI003F851C14
MRAVRPTPSRDPLAIGAKLRATRLAQSLTIADVAAATGLNKGFISKIERDETSPSVSTLISVCEVLSLPVGSLFEAPKSQVVPLSEAPLINMGGNAVIERLVTPRSEAGVQVLRSTMEPGASGGAELYTINCDTEVVHVLSGRLDVRLAAAEHTLEAGDTLTLPGREPHTWNNFSEGTTEVLWVLVPAAWSGSTPS